MKSDAAAARRGPARATWVVYRKEMVDAFRDRRTLATVLVSAVLLGPLVLLMLSGLVATLEAKAEQRSLLISAPERAPTLVNFAERQSFRVRPAPADFEARLADASLADAVVVVPDDFEARLRDREPPVVTLVSDSANGRSQASAARAARLLDGFVRERSTLLLALRGVAPETLRVIELDDRDLAPAGSRSVQASALLPFFVLMAVLAGALNAALDTTAGERERGSLEPLLANPCPPAALVAGKWAAVASIGVLVAGLACLGFLPAERLLPSDTVAAMFRFGGREFGAFMIVLVPFAAAVSALLMAVAIRSRSVKEAQASTALVTLAASLLPLVDLLSLGQTSGALLWVPALGQNLLLGRVLKGEALTLAALAPSLLVSAAIVAGSLAFVVARLRPAASG